MPKKKKQTGEKKMQISPKWTEKWHFSWHYTRKF